MIFTAADLIGRRRWHMTLPASTWIPPSTPARASFTGQPPVLLAASYRVNIEIGGIGRLTNPEEAA